MKLWGVHYATASDFDCFLDDNAIESVADLANPCIVRTLSLTREAALDRGEAIMRKEEFDMLEGDADALHKLNNLVRRDAGDERWLTEADGTTIYAVIVAVEFTLDD